MTQYIPHTLQFGHEVLALMHDKCSIPPETGTRSFTVRSLSVPPTAYIS